MGLRKLNNLAHKINIYTLTDVFYTKVLENKYPGLGTYKFKGLA